MGVETVIAIGRSALELTLVLAGPVLVLSLAAGLAVSIFQALTQTTNLQPSAGNLGQGFVASAHMTAKSNPAATRS